MNLKILAAYLLAMLIGVHAAAAQTATPAPDADQPATCSINAEAEATLEATVEITAEATEALTSDAAIRYLDFEPYDLRFNPTPENPFAIIMNFSLFFESQRSETIGIQRPLFTLEIEGVEWGDLASTDFQIGTLQAHANYGIALQSLTLINRATEAQLEVIECIRNQQPVDLRLIGSIEVVENEVETRIPVEMILPDADIHPNSP